tara:strand:+ start:894 stop:1205 length:312 start_codon:yes stop_codon:yes gene_type:complete
MSHIFYGILAITQPFYIEEFKRYGFYDYRVLIAASQIVAGVGIILGFYQSRITQVSSAILVVMMTGALITRIFIKDDLFQSLPAIIYMSVNSLIFIKSIKLKK